MKYSTTKMTLKDGMDHTFMSSTAPRQFKTVRKSNEMELLELVAQCHVCIYHINIK